MDWTRKKLSALIGNDVIKARQARTCSYKTRPLGFVWATSGQRQSASAVVIPGLAAGMNTVVITGFATHMVAVIVTRFTTNMIAVIIARLTADMITMIIPGFPTRVIAMIVTRFSMVAAAPSV